MKYARELHKSMDNIIIYYTYTIYNAQDDSHKKKKKEKKRKKRKEKEKGRSVIDF